jgi:hypothetical protein
LISVFFLSVQDVSIQEEEDDEDEEEEEEEEEIMPSRA